MLLERHYARGWGYDNEYNVIPVLTEPGVQQEMQVSAQVSGQVTTMPFDKCYTEPLFKVVQIVPDMREHGKEVSEA